MRSAKRLTCLLALLTLSACASNVDLSSFPENESQARLMMDKVAQEAKCEGFEPYNQTADSWKFTCQQGEHGFTLITAASKEVLDGISSKTASEGFAYIAKSTYIVAAAKSADGQKTPELRSSPEWLAPFR